MLLKSPHHASQVFQGSRTCCSRWTKTLCSSQPLLSVCSGAGWSSGFLDKRANMNLLYVSRYRILPRSWRFRFGFCWVVAATAACLAILHLSSAVSERTPSAAFSARSSSRSRAPLSSDVRGSIRYLGFFDLRQTLIRSHKNSRSS